MLLNENDIIIWIIKVDYVFQLEEFRSRILFPRIVYLGQLRFDLCFFWCLLNHSAVFYTVLTILVNIMATVILL